MAEHEQDGYRVALVEVEDGPELRCACPRDVALKTGDQCIVSCGNVLEIGRVTSVEERPGKPADGDRTPRVLRQATLQDHARAQEAALHTRMAAKACAAKAAEMDLPIRLVRVRFSFDRRVLSVIFSAEDNINCNEFVQAMERELRARVEIQQIGVRDEAGIVGGMGPCGRAICCSAWLRRFESVNVRMAKVQMLSLTPGAITGMCGRLKCCLRYEAEMYRRLERTLPREDSRVRTPDGEGTVVFRDVLRQRVRVRVADRGLIEYDANVVQWAKDERRQRGRTRHENPGGQRTEPGVAGEA